MKVPRVLYWQDNSTEAEVIAGACAAAVIGGELKIVDSGSNLLAELDHPRTCLFVLHEALCTDDLLANVHGRYPQARLLLLCKDAQSLSESQKQGETQHLGVGQIDEVTDAMNGAIQHSMRPVDPSHSYGQLLGFEAETLSMLNMVSDAVIVETPDRRIALWNSAAERLFGWTGAQALGRPRNELLIHPDQAAGVIIEATLARDGRWDGDVLYSALHSLQTDVRTQRRALNGKDGERRGWIEVCSEIQDRRFAARKVQLLASIHDLLKIDSQTLEEKLDAIAKMMVPVITDTCIIDLKGDDGVLRRVGFASSVPAIAELEPVLKDEFPLFISTKKTAGKVLQSAQAEVFTNVADPGDFLGVQEPMARKALQKASPHAALTVPILIKRKVVGLLTLLPSTSSWILEKDGLLILQELMAELGLVVEHAQLEQRLRIASQQTFATKACKDAFLGTLSHELRTPLQSMLGWAQLLRDERISREAASKALDSLVRSIKSQGQIISDLLDLSLISAGRLDLELRPCELAPVVAAAVRSVEIQARQKGVEIEMTGVEGPALWVLADLNWLQRAFYNILINAVKFTPGSGNVRIEIATDSKSAKVSITDTGKGIDASYIPRLFENFSQEETGLARTYGGLGVGLAIVRFVVESHGGVVECFSAGEGHGAAFVVSLPTCQPPVTDPGLSGIPKGNKGSLQGVRVLLVEDECDQRELLRFVLMQAGATVTEASTTADGLRCVQQGSFKILVSDIGLPEENGNSMIRKIRQLAPEQGGRIAALALTASGLPEDRVNALRAGFNVHVSKPVDPSELVLMVAQLSKWPSDVI